MLPDKTTMEGHVARLKPYIGNLPGDYKHDENTQITLKDGSDPQIDTILGGTRTTPADAAKIKELAQRAIYNTTVSNGTAANIAYYKNTLGTFYYAIQEFIIYKDTVGLEKIDEILQANANGFTLTGDRGYLGGAPTVGTIAKANTAVGATDYANLVFATQNAHSTPVPAYEANNAVNLNTAKDNFPSGGHSYMGFNIVDSVNLGGGGGANSGTVIALFNKSSNRNDERGKVEIERLRDVKRRAYASGVNDNDNKKKPFDNFGDHSKTDSKDL
jgi:hypothetical protein